MKSRVGVLLMVISAASFGTIGLSARVAYDSGANPVTLMFLRFAISSICMVVLALARRAAMPKGKVLAGLIVMGAVLYFGQSISYFTAVSYVSPAMASMLLYAYPAFVTVLSLLFLHERMTAIKVGALVLAVVGVFLTINPAHGAALDPKGVAWGLGSALCYSVYIVLGARVMKDAEPIAGATVVFVSTGLVYAAVLPLAGPAFPHGNAGWLATFALAIASVVAITAFLMGINYTGPVNASTLSALEPFVALILSIVFLHQSISPMQMVGAALILGAAITLARSGQAKAETA